MAKNAKKGTPALTQKLRTPAVKVKFAHVEFPDDSKFGKGEYGVTIDLSLNDEAEAAFIKELEAIRKKFGNAELAKVPASERDEWRVRSGFKKLNPQRKNDAGDWVAVEEEEPSIRRVKFRTKQRPPVYDTSRNELQDVKIEGGDLVKLSVTASSYRSDGPQEVGATFYLNAVQLLKKRGAFNAADDFDDESDEYESYSHGADDDGGDDFADTGDASDDNDGGF